MSELNTIDTYLNRITSEHRDKPKFMATVQFDVEFYVHMQQLFDSMESEGGVFDLDAPPTGKQEDGIGAWVGVSRTVKEPISGGVFFTWDDTDLDGWDNGSWAPADLPSELVTLPDDAYLVVIKAKIAANNWDGTTPGAYAVWAVGFPTLTLLIQDFQNMSFLVAIVGAPIDALTQALLTQGYIPLKPEGVRITEYIVSVDTNPLFAWDIQNSNMNGWDIGSWGKEVAGA